MRGAWAHAYRIVTAVAVATCLLAAAGPASAALSRQRANASALRVLRPTKDRGATVVFALRAPLRAGTRVFEAAPGVTFHVTPLKHRTWLFWEDEDYQALFAHPSELLLIDAQTGRVIRRQKLEWIPLVNGRRPAFLVSAAAYHNRGFWISSVHTPSARLRRGAHLRLAHAAAPPALAIQPGELKHDCLIMLGDRHDPIVSGSFAAMSQWAKQLGLKSYPDQATDTASLQSTVAKARAFDQCDDVFLFIAGHGMPPPGWHDPATGQVEPGGPAAVNLDMGAVVAAARNGTTVERKLLTPDDLKNLVLDNPTVHFKIKIESCFSGRFAETLLDPVKGQPFASNLELLELSSPATQVSYGQIKVDTYDQRGRLTGHNVSVNDNPFGAGEFTNGDYHGLVQWETSTSEINKTGGSLVQGISDSYQLGLPFNAATGRLPDGTTLQNFTPSNPLLYEQPFSFRPTLTANQLSDGFDVDGWTNGRFDTVQVDAPAGRQIVAYNAHGHNCQLIDDQGHVVPSGSTLAPGRYIKAVRCDRKPVDDDVRIDITLASGRAQPGETTFVTFVKSGQIVSQQILPIHP